MKPKFLLVSTIGVGSFGTVSRANVEHNTQTCALKTISKANRSEQEIASLKGEISICKQLTSARGIVLTVYSYETPQALVVVQERALGDLFRVIKDDGKLSEMRVREIGMQLVGALNYLHNDMRITHRDLKPQNILLYCNGRVAICDFGFARALGTNSSLHTTIKGTPLYMAPELVQEMPYSFRVDIWSLGVILYELVEGVPPFFAASLVDLMKQIVRCDFNMPQNISPEFQTLLRGVLEKDPALRLAWPQLETHPFLVSGSLDSESAAAAATAVEAEEAEGRRRLLELFPCAGKEEEEEASGANTPLVAEGDGRETPSPDALQMKRFLAKIYLEYGQNAGVGEEYISKQLGGNEQRIDFIVALTDKLEHESKTNTPSLPITTLFLLKVVRKLVKMHSLLLPARVMQRLVLALLKHENAKFVSHALKFLDAFLSLKQHATVLNAIVVSEQNDEAIVPSLLYLFLRPSFQLINDACHVLNVLLVNLGHPFVKQVNYYLSQPVVHVFYQILATQDPAYEALQSSVTNVLLLTCSFVSGALVKRLQYGDWTNLLQVWAFERKSATAVGLLECIARFGEDEEEHERWAVTACALLLVQPPQHFKYAHALAKLVLEALPRSKGYGNLLPCNVVLDYLASQHQHSPEESSEAFYSLVILLATTQCADGDTIAAALNSREAWEACWKPARQPNEALQALRCRSVCLKYFTPARKSLVEKIQLLLRKELSPPFLAMVGASPKTHGGGVFGAKRIFLQATLLLEQMLRMDIQALHQGHLVLVLECTFRVFSNLQLVIKDAPALRQVTLFLLYLLDTSSSSSPQHRKIAKQMMESKQALEFFGRIWQCDMELGLRLYSHWVSNGILPGMERHLQDIPSSPLAKSPIALNALLQIISAVCRKSNLGLKNVNDMLREMFAFLANVDSSRMDADYLALAIGNAAFHSELFYPVLAWFVPSLVAIMEHSSSARARTNAALALGNLLRNGPHCDAVIANTNACDLMLEWLDLNEDNTAKENLVELKVIIIALGNFASQERCNAKLMQHEKLASVLEFSKNHVHVEIRSAGERLAGKLFTE